MNRVNPNDFFDQPYPHKNCCNLRTEPQVPKYAHPLIGTLAKPLPPIAKQVIFNPPATIVYWEDGTKTVVKCDNDEFSEEFGFAMACVRKIYGTRNSFKAQFKDAYRPYLKQEKEKVVETPMSQSETENKEPIKKKARPSVHIIKADDIDNPGLDQLLRSLACGDSVSVEPCDRKGVFAVRL